MFWLRVVLESESSCFVVADLDVRRLSHVLVIVVDVVVEFFWRST